MKRNKFHIIRALALLLFFAAGQFVVWSHQHGVQYSLPSKYQPKHVITENCQLCDAMHHTYMAINSPVVFAPVTFTHYVYKQPVYTFTSIALILSAGRSPPGA